ncbi:hypothetical protein TrRE_jg8617, partial [Triparma retinervis]
MGDILWKEYLRVKESEEALAASLAQSDLAKQSTFASQGIENTSSPTGPPVDVKSGVAVVRTISKSARRDAKATRRRKQGEGEQEQSEGILIRAAEEGHGEARVRAGNIMLERGRDRDAKPEVRTAMVKEALRWWESSGRREGWFNAGHLYYDGFEGALERDEARAVSLFKRAEEDGDVDAMFWMGVREGDIGRIRKAKEEGHAGAGHYAALWEYGEGGGGGG